MAKRKYIAMRWVVEGRVERSTPTCVQILEQLFDKGNLDSVFSVSVKTTFFIVFSEKLPIFAVIVIILTSLDNGFLLCIVAGKNSPFPTKLVLFLT